MAIFLKEIKNKKSKFQFPSLPEEISVRKQTNYQSFNILSLGDVKIPDGMRSGSWSWRGTFYGTEYVDDKEAKRSGKFRNSVKTMKKVFDQPQKCVKKLVKWQRAGTPLRLLIDETGINADVTIDSFDYTHTGGFGNIDYTISFAPYEALKIYTIKEKKKARVSKAADGRKQYVIKQGDTLWGLAVQNYGSGLKWSQIYQANKDVLEKAVMQYGYANADGGNRIFPGTSIVIP